MNGKCCPCKSRKNTMSSDRSRPLDILQATKSSKILPVRANFLCTLCTLCKFKYVGKSEISFNLGLNNNRSDIFDRNTIPACRHFVQDKYRFNRHAKFTLIESITNTNKPRKALQELLKRQENFWIKPLETLQPHGMYHELNPA